MKTQNNMSELKYKVGDRVKIKSLDWYNKNKNETGFIIFNDVNFMPEMSRYCGEILTINQVVEVFGEYTMSECGFLWTDEMIEGLVEEENNHLTENVVDAVRESNDRYRIVIDPRFNIEVDEGEYYAVRRKKEYPKTYEECCKVLGVDPDNFLSIRNLYREDGDEESTDYERDLLGKFDYLWELRICRDAYWKIAGEEMGLGKPWEPDSDTRCYVISRDSAYGWGSFHILEFPTPEMRDAFYENFKEKIEQCKELL